MRSRIWSAVFGAVALLGIAPVSDVLGQDPKVKEPEKGPPAVSERRKAFLEQEAAEIARAEKRRTIGDYLEDEDPLYSFVRELGRIVHRDSPNHSHLERLTPAAQDVYNVFHFQASVINGSVRGYYDNSGGNRAHETLAALREIGAPLSAAILAKSLTAFPDGRAPTDRVERYDLTSKDPARYEPLFGELSAHFFDRVSSMKDEDLYKLLLEYMKRRRDEPYKSATDKPLPNAASGKTPGPLPGEAGQLARENLIGAAPTATAVEFTKAFAADRDAAFKKFNASRGLTISGKVKSVERDPEEGLIVELSGDGDQVVRCRRFEDEAVVRARARAGAEVKIKGLWSRHWRDGTLNISYAVFVD